MHLESAMRNLTVLTKWGDHRQASWALLSVETPRTGNSPCTQRPLHFQFSLQNFIQAAERARVKVKCRGRNRKFWGREIGRRPYTRNVHGQCKCCHFLGLSACGFWALGSHSCVDVSPLAFSENKTLKSFMHVAFPSMWIDYLWFCFFLFSHCTHVVVNNSQPLGLPRFLSVVNVLFRVYIRLCA